MQRALPRWLREDVLLPLGRLAPVGARYHRALDNLLAERDDAARHLHWVAGLDPVLLPGLLSPDVRAAVRPGRAAELVAPYLCGGRSGAVVQQLMALDVHTWLVDDVLHKMDRMSMAASVEARVPFLDHRLVEFVASLPLRVKLANLGTKTLLKRAMGPLLPAATIRRRKHAFQIPLDQWVWGPLAGFVRDVLLDPQARRRGWFDPKGVAALLAPQRNGRPADGQSVWTLLCLELWAREFLD